MQKYQDTVLNGPTGRPVAGATVTVTTLAGAPATIYSDNGVTPISTLTTRTDGSFAFYAADGRYTIAISGAGLTTKTITDILLEDPADLAATTPSSITVNSASAALTLTQNGAGYALDSVGRLRSQGVHVLKSGLGMNWAGAVSNSYATSPLYVDANHYGAATISGGAYLNAITINTDQVALTSTQPVNGLAINHNFGGGAASGGRQALQLSLVQTGATQSVANGINPFFVSAAFYSIAQYSEGGTPGYLTGKGHVFGANPVARLQGAATGYYEVSGMEIDVSAATGTTFGAKKGLQIVKEATDAVQGSDGIDTAIYIGDQAGATARWDYGLSFGHASTQWAMGAGSTLIAAVWGSQASVAPDAALGVDFQKVKFSTSAFRSMGFSVSGVGALSAISANIGALAVSSGATGVTLSVPNFVTTGATVAVGGSGYAVGRRIRTATGGVYVVATVTGTAVATVTQLVPDVSNGAAPANPVATTDDFTGPFATGGTGCTLTLTWATGNALTLPTLAATSITTSAANASLTITDTGANGANIKIVGDGATTPKKYLRVQGGSFQIANDAYSAIPLTLTDTGNLSTTGAILCSGTGGVGYKTGAGGTATQGTSKATGVQIDKPSGQITMNAASLAAGAAVSFTLTNAAIAATDTVDLHRASGGTAGAYDIFVDSVAAGSCVIRIKNNTAGALAEAVVLNFTVCKGASA